MPAHALKPILQLQSPCSRSLHSSNSFFSREAKSSWKIPASEIYLLKALRNLDIEIRLREMVPSFTLWRILERGRP